MCGLPFIVTLSCLSFFVIFSVIIVAISIVCRFHFGVQHQIDIVAPSVVAACDIGPCGHLPLDLQGHCGTWANHQLADLRHALYKTTWCKVCPSPKCPCYVHGTMVQGMPSTRHHVCHMPLLRGTMVPLAIHAILTIWHVTPTLVVLGCLPSIDFIFHELCMLHTFQFCF